MTKEKQLPDIYALEYDFIDNGAGDLMLVMESVEKIQHIPTLYFDGVFQAVLKRRPDQLIALPRLTKTVREMLLTVPKIIVSEMDDDDEILEVYEVPVIVSNDGSLPYPKELLDQVDIKDLLAEVNEQ